jgi:hypothetical protein
MLQEFQIRQLEERIHDFERAVRRFDDTGGSDDPMVIEFRERLVSMKAEMTRLTAPAKLN